MWDLIKKYFDIFSGVILGVVLSIIAKFELHKIQLIYSIIILILVCIGVCSVVRKTAQNKDTKNKRKKKRNKIFIDKLVDSRKEVKAVNIAQNPLQDGQELYETLKKSRKDLRKIMKKVKKFFDKFKGWLTSIVLALISIIAEFGGFIEDIFNGKLIVKGVNIVSLIALILSLLIALLSDTHTTEQIKKIKEMFTKKPSNEIVNEQLKARLKEEETKRKGIEKQIDNSNANIDSYTKDLEQAKNVYNARIEMLNMTPPFATEVEVQEALAKVNDIENKIANEKNTIVDLDKQLLDTNTIITMLKARLEQ